MAASVENAASVATMEATATAATAATTEEVVGRDQVECMAVYSTVQDTTSSEQDPPHVSRWLTNIEDSHSFRKLQGLYLQIGTLSKHQRMIGKILKSLTKLDKHGNVPVTQAALSKLISRELSDVVEFVRMDILPECKRWVGHIIDASNVTLDDLHASNWRPRVATAAACMQLTVGKAVADLCMASLFEVDEAEAARCRLVKTIDAYVVAAHGAEIQTLDAVLAEMVKLRNSTAITTQMVHKSCNSIKVMRYANQNFKRLIFVVHRLLSDVWFEFSRAVSGTPFLPLLSLVVDAFVPTSDDGTTDCDQMARVLADRFVEMLTNHGAAVATALTNDIHRVTVLMGKGPFAPEWTGTKLSEYSEGQSVSLLCPAFAPFWKTSTRKLYLTNCQGENCRSLMVLRACMTMREIVVRGFMPADSLYLDYLNKTLEQQVQSGRLRLQAVALDISNTCVDVGLIGMTVVGIVSRSMKKAKVPETDEERVEQAEFEGSVKEAVHTLMEAGAADAADAADAAPDPTALERTVVPAPLWTSDTLIFPLSFESSEQVQYQMAHPWVRLEYVLIAIMHSFLRKSILSSRHAPASTSLEARVVARAAIDTDPKYASLALSEIESRVCHVGAKCGQAILGGHRNAVLDGTCLPPVTILASQNCTVRFGVDTFDKFASVCAEGLFRIKVYLQYGTPLPSGMSYKISEPHRGSRAKKLT